MVRKAAISAFTPWLNRNATRVELQRLASLIGVPVSGTKPEVSAAIQHAVDIVKDDLHGFQTKNTTTLDDRSLSIVSIDMGIRNLAYAHLTTRLELEKGTPESQNLAKPILQAWRRISVGHNLTCSQTEPTAFEDFAVSASEDTDTEKRPEDSFEPLHLAVYAYACCKDLVKLQPTHVLIERQRFRSGGHAAVQEWSLRVGVFEGMLYSTLRTLAEEGVFNGRVEPILPARVNRFWLQENDRDDIKSDRLLENPSLAANRVNGKEAKRAKIDLVAEMIELAESSNADFDVAEGAQGTVASFMEGYYGVKSRKRNQIGSIPPLKKLDDLSDSLLQGLAWLEWQANRLSLRSRTTN